MLKVLFARCCRRLENKRKMSVSLRRIYKPRTDRNSHPLRPTDRPFGTCFPPGAKGERSQVRLTVRICHLKVEVVATGQDVAWSSHHMWDLHGQGEV